MAAKLVPEGVQEELGLLSKGTSTNFVEVGLKINI
jgi:hypothetical protein